MKPPIKIEHQPNDSFTGIPRPRSEELVAERTTAAGRFFAGIAREIRTKTPIEIFRERLNKGERVLFPGGIGELISHRGIKTALPLWSASALLSEKGREVVKGIHAEYIDAGAHVITTNTFRTNPRKFIEAGLTSADAREATFAAVRLAQEARSESGREDVAIGGSIGPVEECYEPTLVPSDEELKAEHAELVGWLKEAGVDFLCFETINKICEAKIAAETAEKAGLPFTISFVCDAEGNLLSGEPIERAVEAVSPYQPLAIATNCRPLGEINKSVERLLAVSLFPVGVYANGGEKPNLTEQNWEHTEDSDTHACQAEEWARQGVQIIGGCCGTTPDHTRAQKKRLFIAS